MKGEIFLTGGDAISDSVNKNGADLTSMLPPSNDNPPVIQDETAPDSKMAKALVLIFGTGRINKEELWKD